MGRRFVELLSHASNLPIITCNRGNVYWDGTTNTTPERTFHVHLDWEVEGSVRSMSTAVWGCISKDSPNSSLFIVDFSCTEPHHMVLLQRHLLLPLAHRIRRYCLVSTDSVYATTNRSDTEPADARVTECGACVDFPPVMTALFRRLNPLLQDELDVIERDILASLSYGEEKRAVELLLAQYGAPRFNCTMLRLPDVIGPFDRSGRYWATVLWLLSGVPLALPVEVASRRMSVVFSEDVVRWIINEIAFEDSQPLQRSPGLETLNLCCQESPTLEDFVSMIRHSLSQEEDQLPLATIAVVSESEGETGDYYPSVDCGPISCHEAFTKRQWLPTPLAAAIHATTMFFSSAEWYRADGQRAELRKALKKLPPHVLGPLTAQRTMLAAPLDLSDSSSDSSSDSTSTFSTFSSCSS